MNWRRGVVRVLLLLCVCLAPGCSWLQDEFFTLDRAAPAAEPQAGVEPRW